MKPRHLDFGLCFIGLVVPNAPFVRWLVEHGPSPQPFAQESFANGVSAFFGMGVVISTVPLGACVLVERARLRLQRR